MTASSERSAAESRLDQVCEQRPELRALAALIRQVLAVLFADPPRPVFASEDVVHAWSWSGTEGERALAAVPLEAHEEPLQRNWLQLGAIFQAEEPAAMGLSAATTARKVSASTLLRTLLQAGSAECLQSLQRANIPASLGFTWLRLASLPILSSIAPAWQERIRAVGWDHAFCPLCGNPPLLAEFRGLEQLRWLRCGWCAAEWSVDRIYCPSCRTRDHHHLRDVVTDGAEEGRRLNLCDACGTMIPALHTLMRLSPPALLVAEMETMDLRVIAERLERDRSSASA
jgi:formate dehydrogenase maturation protein FdhE